MSQLEIDKFMWLLGATFMLVPSLPTTNQQEHFLFAAAEALISMHGEKILSLIVFWKLPCALPTLWHLMLHNDNLGIDCKT